MHQQIVSEAAFGLKLDNGLLVSEIANGQSPDYAEALSLAALAQSLYISVSMESRQLGDIAKCHRLWAEVAQLFDELCGTWTDVESDDPQIHWLRSRLTHFQSLCRDRMALYDVSERQRLAHAARRDADLPAFSERSD